MPKDTSNRRPWWCGVLVASLMLMGCSETVYHGLSEAAANEMVVVLEQNAIEANKIRDSAGDGLWAVSVPSEAKVEAWRVLESEGLPRPVAGGFAKFYPSGGLIPTTSEERILLQYATAQELQQTLLKIEGVIDAHVNLVLPEKPRVQLSSHRPEPPRSSVLIKYQPLEGKPPISEPDVQALMAGGVEGLAAEDVRVIMTPLRRIQDPLQKPAMAQLGPIAVAQGSKGTLQGLIILMGAFIVLLAGGLAFVIIRRKA